MHGALILFLVDFNFFGIKITNYNVNINVREAVAKEMDSLLGYRAFMKFMASACQEIWYMLRLPGSTHKGLKKQDVREDLKAAEKNAFLHQTLRLSNL